MRAEARALPDQIGNLIVLLLVASGLLMNTALFNAGEVGIPVYYGVIPLVLALYVAGLAGHEPLHCPSKALQFFFGGIGILVIVTSLHSVTEIGESTRELKQVVSRAAFFVLFLVAVGVFRSIEKAKYALRALVNGLKVAVVYGLYQIVAGFMKWPLFLEFLRNSNSFNFAESGIGGWVKQYRIFSIWAEPSFAALPVGIFFFWLLFESDSKREKRVWYPLLILFSILTFSRLVWAIMALALLQAVVLSPILRSGLGGRLFERMKYIGVILVSLIALEWVSFAKAVSTDASTLIRSSSVAIGLKIALQHPFLGTGFNSFAELGNKYSTFYTEESFLVVDNLFVSYAQQLGIWGLLLAFLPIFYVLSLPISAPRRCFAAGIFIVIGTLGGDFFYFSMAWIFLAILGAEQGISPFPEMAMPWSRLAGVIGDC